MDARTTRQLRNHRRFDVANGDLRQYMAVRGVYQYEVAARLGILEPNMSRLMRYTLPEEKANEIREVVDAIAEGR